MRTHVTPATVLGLLLGAAAGYSGSSSVVVVRSKVERMKGEGDIDTLDRWQCSGVSGPLIIVPHTLHATSSGNYDLIFQDKFLMKCAHF